jgi:hypothetical protein
MWTATTCSAGASSPSYPNSSSAVGLARRAVLMARASVDGALMALSGVEASDSKSVCASGGASTVGQELIARARASATTAAGVMASGPVRHVRMVQVTRRVAQTPARPRPK